MKNHFHEEGARALAVFSHPNHELAVFGLLQRLRPGIVYLTDGGGPKRVAETEEGLASIGLHEQASFLNYAESEFYDSLLARDYSFFKKVSDQIAAIVSSFKPAQILCDAVEFYNPIHDLTAPIVQCALKSSGGVQVFEVPLAYQKTLSPEQYEVQRLPSARRECQIEIRLTEEELDKKVNGRDRIYTTLLNQAGSLTSNLSRAHLGLEVVAPVSATLPKPDGDRILRYEWRAALLLHRGIIERVITYSNHYLPIALALLGSATE